MLIKNQPYGLCVDVPGERKGRPDGRLQDVYSVASSRANQRWTLKRVLKGRGTGGAALYLIRNVTDGLCRDLPDYGPVLIRTPMTEYHCDGAEIDNQLWWLDKRPGGAYWIRNQKSGDTCLDLARTDKKSPHANLRLFTCGDRDDHQWRCLKT